MKVRTIRSAILAASLLGSVCTSGIAAATPNTSSYSMQVSGNTISVYETSSEAVNTVEASFAYTDSANAVQSVSVAPGSTFTTCFDQTSSKVTCTALGGNITGTHLVASLTMNLKAGVSSANVSVSVSGGSILSSTDNTDTLNHSTLPSATYSYSAPAPTPTQSAPKATAPTTSNKSANTSGTTNSGATSTDTPAAEAPKTDISTPAETKKATTKTPEKTVNTHRTGVVTTSLAAIVIVAAAAYWLVVRKRTELTATPVYKLDNKASKAKSTAKRRK
jgi:hypothetical protein